MIANLKRPDYDKAAAEAKRVLDENFILGPPVLAHELAENYGLKVIVTTNLDPGVAGMLEVENKRIIVNEHDSYTRQAFTIAHELGHWLLHVNLGEINENETLYRKPLGGPCDDWREQEANWFAANLLVPSEMLEAYQNLNQEEAARLFRVSPSVIGYRRIAKHG